MKIKKDTRALFLKLSDYKSYNFVEEHKNKINENGFVWVLKLGKKINSKVLEDLYESKGGIIFRSSKRNGNKFYYCNLVKTPKLDDELIIPDYYYELLSAEGYTIEMVRNNGEWFKIDSMTELTDESIKKFVSVSSGNDLTICSKARSSYVNIKCENDIEI